jgi:hypothetical protein
VSKAAALKRAIAVARAEIEKRKREEA